MGDITKVGLALVKENRILLVRKRNSSIYILPGGKPEKDEDDLTALSREIEEEIGCHLDPGSAFFLASFSDKAADLPGVKITVRLYAGTILGRPEPRSEIEQLIWFSPYERHPLSLAPSLNNFILPFLFPSTTGSAKESSACPC